MMKLPQSITNVLILLSIALISSACIATPIAKPVMSISDNSQPETVDETMVAQGVKVYLDNYCGVCHTLEIANTRGVFGPAHDHVATLAVERIQSEKYYSDETTVEGYLRESLLEPQAFIVPEYIATSHAMPAFAHLDEADIEALIYMLSHQY